ncbi:hypothetical protein [Polymorphospora sp. A560]|uniref:hypothetical protein n=1 Tax=Polymorphospora sp. A560 TaxID=3040203 RepID=UPI003892C325
MVEVPDSVLAEMVRPVIAAMPLIIARIPKAPAAELGRLRAVVDGDAWPIREAAFRAGPVFGARPASGSSPVQDALGSLPPLLVERLLGALELTVPELDLADTPDLTSLLNEPTPSVFLTATGSGQSEAVTGATVLQQIRPGVFTLVTALARRLATDPRVAVLLTVAPETTEEQEIAAAHGGAQLALAVATAAAVTHKVGIPPWATTPPAVLGVAIGAAVLLLRETRTGSPRRGRATTGFECTPVAGTTPTCAAASPTSCWSGRHPPRPTSCTPAPTGSATGYAARRIRRGPNGPRSRTGGCPTAPWAWRRPSRS